MDVRQEFRHYAEACYVQDMGAPQAREVEQAFLSGIYCVLTANQIESDWSQVQRQIKARLMEIGSFPIDGN